jgi:uncharacterized protein
MAHGDGSKRYVHRASGERSEPANARIQPKMSRSIGADVPVTVRMTKEWKDAVRRASVDEVQRLLDAGADIDVPDEHGQTALMLAAMGGQRQIVECLVGHGAHLNHTAKYGLSALMLAVVNGHAEVVRLLVRAGADPDLRGTGAPGFAGKTALDLAIARDEADMADMLRARAGEAC